MVILGLGSNIGDKMTHLNAAIAELSTIIKEVCRSAIYTCPAMLPEGAPREWDISFYNMAIGGECDLPPLELLSEIKNIEQKLGRQDRGRWGPREIDIDILAMGDEVFEWPELCIPHKGLLERDFALLPLADIAPGWRYPGQHFTARELCIQKGFTLEAAA